MNRNIQWVKFAFQEQAKHLKVGEKSRFRTKNKYCLRVLRKCTTDRKFVAALSRLARDCKYTIEDADKTVLKLVPERIRPYVEKVHMLNQLKHDVTAELLWGHVSNQPVSYRYGYRSSGDTDEI